MVRNAMLCSCHAFLDGDNAGRGAYEKAKNEGLLTVAEITFATVPGMQESELEDLYDFHFYKEFIWNKYNVSLDTPKFKGNKKKWKDRVKEAFLAAGKPWDNAIEMELKAGVANLVVLNPVSSVHPNKRGPLDALVSTLVARLGAST
jgi:hypothetical protein